MSHAFDVSTSLLASQLRKWRGTASFRPVAQQPDQPLQLFDMEGCPYCRLVREVLTELDLDVLVQPCPKGGRRFRNVAKRLGGKTQFPFLIDPNTGSSLYESADIIRYLKQTYAGRGRRPPRLRHLLGVASSMLASATRQPGRTRGVHARPSKAPKLPLELYSFESSPYSRLVREVLCELELPYLLRNTGKARWQDMGPPAMRTRLSRGLPTIGRNRLALEARTGRIQLPYLIDPNSGVEMYESAKIIAYLESSYAA